MADQRWQAAARRVEDGDGVDNAKTVGWRTGDSNGGPRRDDGVQFDEEGGTGLGWMVETTVNRERERSTGDDAHPTQRRNDGRPAVAGNGTLAGWRGKWGSGRR
ncbi:hypothetical protein E2562_036067 [Oryza meyeriana var. granulata]|uniref:DUF834 domain-containing protein n=1 Tax=Oryza meyeriana var. granulata TaxID=110450 RepID=A0A6G1D977_9ORYZ|nr:hypothetical protein E2562_030272 [Oryza meyeriana var. granulata]KAF0909420.1 hypothetical protein E2562_036067 [Oryza meyeriana var. granulata]